MLSVSFTEDRADAKLENGQAQMKGFLTVLLTALALATRAASNPGWTLVRSEHFEVYSHSAERNAEETLQWLERLHAFFIQIGLVTPDAEERSRVRVIGFDSFKEYEIFRTKPAADAYALMTEGRDYLVFPELGAREAAVAAHEYAHAILH
jgi:hypothetical protein